MIFSRHVLERNGNFFSLVCHPSNASLSILKNSIYHERQMIRGKPTTAGFWRKIKTKALEMTVANIRFVGTACHLDQNT